MKFLSNGYRFLLFFVLIGLVSLSFTQSAFASTNAIYVPQADGILVGDSSISACSAYDIIITNSDNSSIIKEYDNISEFSFAYGIHNLAAIPLYDTYVYNLNLYCHDSSTSRGQYTFTYSNSASQAPTPTPSPTPTPTPAIQIVTNPSTTAVAVGTPFNVNVDVNDANGASTPFNAASATVALSSNLSVTGIHNATSNACNFQYTVHPTPSDPSFAGAIFGGSSTGCTVYTLTLTPTSAGTGTITFTNASIKAYADNSEILTGVQNGSFTLNVAGTSPTPTPPLTALTITSPTETYQSSFTLTGTKDANTTTVFVNGSSTGVTYPTSTTWSIPDTLSLGSNNTAGNNSFTVYGKDGNGNQTATITGTVSLHTLGDINGDGVVDLTDASLFATDWGKTDPSAFTYVLSDMNNDEAVDLTDLSILAKLEQ